jgi:hypothetical protein
MQRVCIISLVPKRDVRAVPEQQVSALFVEVIWHTIRRITTNSFVKYQGILIR